MLHITQEGDEEERKGTCEETIQTIAAAKLRYRFLKEPFLGGKLHQQISVGIYQSLS